MTLLLGCDFSSAPTRRKPIVLALGTAAGGRVQLMRLEKLDSLSAFGEWLRQPQEWIGGFDFPFGLPRSLVEELGWPTTWRECMAHYAALTRPQIRETFAAYCDARPVGSKFAHRKFDKLAGSSPSMKWVNPPVAYMLHSALPLLLEAGVDIPGLHAGDPRRVALEAYPGLLARELIARRSYKSDDKAKQDADRLIARKDLLTALEQGRTRLGLRLKVTHAQHDALVADASGDSLDAVLCLVQAAWAAQQGAPRYGLPADLDPLEGWIVSVEPPRRAGLRYRGSMTTDVRKGQAPKPHPRDEFRERFLASFQDPAFQPESEAISRLEAIAWDAFKEGRKAPVTRKAGAGFKDPTYDLSVEWYETRQKLRAAQARWGKSATPSRVLVVCASPRNDGTCPGEISKTFRLAKIAQDVLKRGKVETELLDLSLLTSDYQRHIHPCKGCVSTAMPLCHWPCSCYPNHALNQVGDWMNEIYEKWVSAHGVLLVTPTHWYQVSSPLKLMMDRLVCADGGNTDPTSTGGKDPAKAKKLERAGWSYPKHLAGRAYGVVVHGDVTGIDGTRRATCDWLDWMGLIDAGPKARLDRYIGYYEPYADSHKALDKDEDVQEETRNVARALLKAVRELRAGKLSAPGKDLKPPLLK